MKTEVIADLSTEQKAAVLDMLIAEIDEIHKGYGRPIGSYQLLEWIERYTIKLGFKRCPHCGRGGDS